MANVQVRPRAAHPSALRYALCFATALAAAGARFISRSCERSRQRRALAQLDDRSLRDIGVSRMDVARECGKPFWR